MNAKIKKKLQKKVSSVYINKAVKFMIISNVPKLNIFAN